jgi:hypothetical protein
MRYQNIPIAKSIDGKQMYITVKYPNIPLSENDVYILANSTDRYDKLALDYYDDASLWWIISIANNNLPQNSLYLPLGSYIRIPSGYLEILSQFNILNQIN